MQSDWFKFRLTLFDWIIFFIILVLFSLYRLMMTHWIPVSTLSDTLVRRFLFVFIITFISGVHTTAQKRKSKAEEWLERKPPWYLGVIWVVVIEWMGLSMLYRTLRVGTFSEVIHSWISQWWIIGIVILLGISGYYCGQLLGQKWQIRRRERRETNMRSDVAHI